MKRMKRKSCLFLSKSERRNSQQPHCKIMNFLTVSGEEELLGLKPSRSKSQAVMSLKSKLWELALELVLAELVSVQGLSGSALAVVLAELGLEGPL
jgi:hypothetical protein